jgi:DNA-binding PadR family transcriptional regulator
MYPYQIYISPMSNPTVDQQNLSPLSPAVFHVLLALAQGDKHGYAIMQDVAATTEGGIHMGPGTLYGTIKRMVKAGLILETDERPDPELDDERRRYYRLTELGSKAANTEARRLASLVTVARRRGLAVAH